MTVGCLELGSGAGGITPQSYQTPGSTLQRTRAR
jgi:hypothetical protein